MNRKDNPIRLERNNERAKIRYAQMTEEEKKDEDCRRQPKKSEEN